ncbi:MAG: hypothetical protein ACRCTZ_14605 [Sarcina sp.]
MKTIIDKYTALKDLAITNIYNIVNRKGTISILNGNIDSLIIQSGVLYVKHKSTKEQYVNINSLSLDEIMSIIKSLDRQT